MQVSAVDREGNEKTGLTCSSITRDIKHNTLLLNIKTRNDRIWSTVINITQYRYGCFVSAFGNTPEANNSILFDMIAINNLLL